MGRIVAVKILQPQFSDSNAAVLAELMHPEGVALRCHLENLVDRAKAIGDGALGYLVINRDPLHQLATINAVQEVPLFGVQLNEIPEFGGQMVKKLDDAASYGCRHWRTTDGYFPQAIHQFRARS